MIRYLKRIRLAKVTKAPFGAGAFIPGNILIIGEQAADPKNNQDQLPFCSDQGCSGWLNRQLNQENISEEKLFWINALNNDSTFVELELIVSKLIPSMIIALGKKADQLCIIHAPCCALDYHYFPHPQYWKRFQSKKRYPLLDLLANEMNNIPERNINLEL